VILDASASTDPDSTSGTNDDIVSFEWFLDPGQATQALLGTDRTLNITLGLGTHTIGLVVMDTRGATGAAEAVITIRDGTPPALTCPAATSAECTGPEGAHVSMVAIAIDTCSPMVSISNTRTSGADASGVYPLGSTSMTFTAIDLSGNTVSCTASATVQDTIPPTLTLSADPPVLWPPNHRMVPVGVTWTASDRCDEAPRTLLESTTSSEPDDASGEGDGRTTLDIMGFETGTADADGLLRAERSGTGPGRTYQLIYTSADASGNRGSALAMFLVPHDLGSGPEPLLLRVDPNGQPGMAQVYWNAVAGAREYDLISGDLGNLAIQDGRVSLGEVRVLVRHSTGTSWMEGSGGIVPAPGKAFFYLVQYRSGGGESGYGTESAALPSEPSSCEGGCPGPQAGSSPGD
jgi:hypothetical protein